MAADPITSNTINELLNYNVSDDDDIFGDKPTRDDKATLSPRAQKRRADDEKENVGLGLDEEVKITKKRKPIAKLDEERLLGQAGIPKLRTLARSGQFAKKLRLKGSGHEFSDTAKLLNYYQLWLDNLYPRAKFADGLQMVEKVGHSKRMQVMRKEWIDEGKPGYLREKDTRQAIRQQPNDDDWSEGVGLDVPTTSTEKSQDEQAAATRSTLFGGGMDDDDLFIPDIDTNPKAQREDEIPEDDELEALMAAHNTSHPAKSNPEPESEDDLDALLAEQDSRRSTFKPSVPTHAAGSQTKVHHIDGPEDLDDLDALLAERETNAVKSTVSTNLRRKTTIFDDSSDEEDYTLTDFEKHEEPQTKSPSDQALVHNLPQLPSPPAKSRTSALQRSPNKLSPTKPQAHHSSPLKRLTQEENILPSSSPIPNDIETVEDLDRLFAEQEKEAEEAAAAAAAKSEKMKVQKFQSEITNNGGSREDESLSKESETNNNTSTSTLSERTDDESQEYVAENLDLDDLELDTDDEI